MLYATLGFCKERPSVIANKIVIPSFYQYVILGTVHLKYIIATALFSALSTHQHIVSWHLQDRQ